jgi:hypothetical protein
MNFETKRNIRLFLFISFILANSLNYELSAQDFGSEKVDISNYVRRMYYSHPFNGIKILQTQDGVDYMISVVELKKETSKLESIQSRIASIKAKGYASQYMNGSNVSTEVLVVAIEEKVKDSVIIKTSMNEIMKESSIGFVDGIELLTKFESADANFLIYVFYKNLKK